MRTSADPADWEAIGSAEAKTNPRINPDFGNLALVPVERRVAGPGASYVMAPFVHVSTDRPGRFTDGSYGVYSAGDDDEVAIREVAYHHAQAMTATNQAPGWTSQFRMLVGTIDARLHDVSGLPAVLLPEDYSESQRLGCALRDAGSDGIVYLSVRSPGRDLRRPVLARCPNDSGAGHPLRLPLGRNPCRSSPGLHH